tara:strand:- start:303 stop:599 length:297 start_codon:yes stop_codon:yes gene_type:complete
MKKIILILSLSIFFVSCGDAGKVLRNEKIRTTDEFLVKKKGPLVLPPDFDKIPSPGSINEKKTNEEENIKKILKSSNNNKTRNKPSSIEKLILEEIRK